MIQITRGLNGEMEKREDLRNEINRTSDGLTNTPLQVTGRCAAAPPPIGDTLQYLAAP